MKDSSSYPNCKTCKFFSITWQKNYPHACSAFNMKSFAMPSLEVFRRSGMHCLYYQKKAIRFEKTDDDEVESDKGDDGEVIKSLEDNDDRRNIDYKI